MKATALLSASLLVASAALLLPACNKGDDAGPAMAAPAEIVPVTVPGPVAEVGACKLDGTWTSTSASGKTTSLVFNADGSGYTENMGSKDELAWKMDGETFTFHGTKVREGGRLGCTPANEGKYLLKFAPDCAKLTSVYVNDPCNSRGRAMNGMVIVKK